MEEIIEACNGYIKRFPNRQDDIEGLRDLALSEVEEGESLSNELEHLYSSLEEIEEEENGEI